jgi:hypothetical protein
MVDRALIAPIGDSASPSMPLVPFIVATDCAADFNKQLRERLLFLIKFFADLS